jgi:hypothetical protein
MKVAEARELVLALINEDLIGAAGFVRVDATRDAVDAGRFMLDGKPARAIHQYDGWYVPIDLGWFDGGFNQPEIHSKPFYWYVFAMPRRNRYRQDHYLVCDYLQVRSWVLEFAAPLGRDHRDHRNWRADLRIFTDQAEEAIGYFRWGDEPAGSTHLASRVFPLDNVATISELLNLATPLGPSALATGAPAPRAGVGSFGPGGESAAHHRLKLYVAAHPTEFGMSNAAEARVEYRFVTGDRVDVLFENHLPDRTVVEIEVEGEDNICVGIHQAVKYRSLAEVDGGYALSSARVGSLVVAYATQYRRALELAERYEVKLQPVDREAVLAAAV